MDEARQRAGREVSPQACGVVGGVLGARLATSPDVPALLSLSISPAPFGGGAEEQHQCEQQQSARDQHQYRE